jgi:hypothetical protein
LVGDVTKTELDVLKLANEIRVWVIIRFALLAGVQILVIESTIGVSNRGAESISAKVEVRETDRTDIGGQSVCLTVHVCVCGTKSVHQDEIIEALHMFRFGAYWSQ